MKVKGQVVSAVSVSPKGVGLKVFVPELGDTFRVYISADRLKGQQNLKMQDFVDVDFTRFFTMNNEVRMDVVDIQKAK